MQDDYFDESTRERLDPEAVMAVERAEFEIFKNMAVHAYLGRIEALGEGDGKVLKMTWGRINAGSIETPEVMNSPCWQHHRCVLRRAAFRSQWSLQHGEICVRLPFGRRVWPSIGFVTRGLVKHGV